MADLPERPRIEPLPPLEDQLGHLNIFRTFAHNETLARGFRRLGGHLLGDGVLPARDREIVILRVGARAGCEYEFGQHRRLAREAGITEDEIGHLAGDAGGRWREDEAALIRMVDELCDHDVVSGGTWDQLRARWSDAQLLELLVLCGFYRLTCGVLNSVGIALERATPGWPDGVAGRRAPRDDRA